MIFRVFHLEKGFLNIFTTFNVFLCCHMWYILRLTHDDNSTLTLIQLGVMCEETAKCTAIFELLTRLQY